LKNKPHQYSNFKIPKLNCKHCDKEMKLTEFSESLLKIRGPYHATYLYRCDCKPDDVQVLPIEKYPQIGELY